MMQSKLSSLDQSFWNLETATTSQTISILTILESAPEKQSVGASLEQLVLNCPKMKQVVVKSATRSLNWQQQDSFKTSRHLSFLASEKENSLAQSINEALSFRFSNELPMWRVLVFNHPKNSGLHFNHCLLFQCHHCFCDGVGLMEMVEALCHEADGKTPVIETSLHRKKRYKVTEFPRREISFTSLLNSLKTLSSDALRTSASGPFNGVSSSLREASYLELDLKEVNNTRRLHGLSMYEYMIYLTKQSLDKYQQEKGLGHKELTFIVPVSMRAKGSYLEIGNNIGAASITLPTATITLPTASKTPEQSLMYDVQERIKAVKANFGADSYLLLSRVLACLPSLIQRKIAEFGAKKTNCICTSVPGAIRDQYLGGAKVLYRHGMAALMRGQGLAFAYMRSQKTMSVTIVSDPNIIGDSHRILELLAYEHRRLRGENS